MLTKAPAGVFFIAAKCYRYTDTDSWRRPVYRYTVTDSRAKIDSSQSAAHTRPHSD